MYIPPQTPTVGGYTLRTIHLCKERVRQRCALEEALEEAQTREARIFQGPIPKWEVPVHDGSRTTLGSKSALDREKYRGHGHGHDHDHDRFGFGSSLKHSGESKEKRRELWGEDSSEDEVVFNNPQFDENISWTKGPLELNAPPLTLRPEPPEKKQPHEHRRLRRVIDPFELEFFGSGRKGRGRKWKEKSFEPECEALENEPEEKKAKKHKVNKKIKEASESLDKWEKDLLNELLASCAEHYETWLLVKYSMSDKAKRTVSDKSINSQNNDGKKKGKHKNRKSGSISAPDDKFSKNRSNEEQRTYICTCSSCGGPAPNPPCNPCDALNAIEEDKESDCGCGQTQVSNPCGACNSCPQCNPPEADPCAEFFDVMRDSMEDAVKKSLEEVFGKYFCSCMEKIQCLASQIDHNECIMSKVFTDLNDKISYYGERNAQQFQYLCVRMEHDRLFYQQQQEYFMKQAVPQKSPCVDEAETICRCNKPEYELTDEEKERHKKGRYWDCTLDPENDESAEGDKSEYEEDSKGLRGSKSRIGKPPSGKLSPPKQEPPGKQPKKK